VERTEVAEIEALRSMFAAVPDDIAGELGVEMLEMGQGLAVKVGFLSGANEVNHALGISSTEQLEALPGFYGRTRHIVSPEPGVELDGRFLERGYEPGYAWMKFSRAAGDAPDARTDLDVVEVGPDEDVEFGRTVGEGFGLPTLVAQWLARLPGRPGWHCFVAYHGCEPAAAGALHVFEDVGWLGLGATRSEFRRRGAQGAILAARIEKAAQVGCTLVVTETGELVEDRPSHSYRNILRAGFEPEYVRPNYALKATDPARASQVNTTGSIRPA